MMMTKGLIIPAAMLFLFISFNDACCQPAEQEDRTLSPYFFVKGEDTATEALPLKSASASVRIAGVISDVLVTQVYKNEGRHPIEAVYVFPASTRAAVYGMKMTIGTRVIEAKIKKKDDARQEYEQAREQGKSASLLEQQRPNVFQMNVANIMPGDQIRVELKYTELIVPTDGVYQFVYPTVVGPRYSNRPEENAPQSSRWVQNPYLHQGQAPTYHFDLHAGIDAGMPIREITCPSHKVNVSYAGPAVADVKLAPEEKNGGNRDFILRYRLEGDKIQTGLLLSEGAREKFFLLMMQPPRRVKTSNIPGREYIFIVDVSGSMYGFPLDVSKRLMKGLLGNLRKTDRFNVLLFSGGSALLSGESLDATPENIAKAVSFIERQQGGGGTELLPALKQALALKRSRDFSRTIVIATDGYVNVEEEAFDLIRNNLGNANMFTFGIGTSVNRHLIEGMAHVGMGEPFVITDPGQAQAAADRFRSLIQSPVLTQVRVDFKGFDAYEVQPAGIPDVLADRPVLVFGKWRGRPEGSITLSGITGEGRYSQTVTVEGVKPSAGNSALRYLWARHRITILSDYNMLRADDKRIKEVTDLGLSYSLLTNYTSFVAVDTEVRNKTGRQTMVKQPLSLPEGVSDYAVGKAGMCKPALQGMNRCMPAREALGAEDASLQAPGVVREKKDKVKAEQGLSIRDVRVSKGLTRMEATLAVQSHLQEIEACLKKGSFRGTFELSLVISPDGTVKGVQIRKGAGMDNAARACLLRGVKQWRLSPTQDGREASLSITLVL
jgi:Ca-activated chloride channel homolog